MGSASSRAASASAARSKGTNKGRRALPGASSGLVDPCPGCAGGGSTLPSAAECTEQINLRRRHRIMRLGQGGRRFRIGALGVQQRQEIDLSFSLTRLNDTRCPCRVVMRRRQRLTTVERLGVSRQRGVRFLQRA